MEHKTGNTVKGLAISGLLTFVFMQAAPVDAADVYRWVDENGEVHYSATLPPEYKDKMHDKLNSQGLVVDENLSLKPEPPPEEVIPEEEQLKELPRDSSNLPRPKQLYSEAEMQRKMDNFLMLRYDSEQEITDAMNVEIKQLNYDRHLIEGTQGSMHEAYRGQVREAGDRQRAGLAVDDSVQREINRLQADIAENAEALAGLEERELSIRAEFQKQLERYRFLVEQAEAEAMTAGESSG